MQPRPDAPGPVAANAQATDQSSLSRLFGEIDGLLPLWIAEPYIEPSPEISAALTARAEHAWYGYEVRPSDIIDSFWAWMAQRHRWDPADLLTSVSPSVGTSIAVVIEQHSKPGDGVILQPPVFTDFKPIITASHRAVVRNPLVLGDAGYRMDLDDLAAKAADPATRVMILCNPHNPVGRAWTSDELAKVAYICADNDVLVVADEIHADLTLSPHHFTPFGEASAGSGVGWAATHGPIKTFGLAGVCDSLLVTGDERISDMFETRSSQLHLTRNNVFGTAALEAAYGLGEPWLDDLLDLIATNVALLGDHLPDGIDLIAPESTYLAWIDFRGLGMDVPQLAHWLASSARLALSPGHWFGREGAGFARMTVAAPTDVVATAIDRLTGALGGIIS